jgi:hypothetical protein
MTTAARYPVGPFEPSPESPAVLAGALADIEQLPARLRAAVAGLDDRQLDTPYRADGWTVRQVVHHLADSHINALVRLKLALTESHPTIKPYDENAWAALPDVRMPIAVSLGIVDGVHARMVTILRSLAPEQIQRTFMHPEHGKVMTVSYLTQNYAWHGRHHVAHITSLRTREGW